MATNSTWAGAVRKYARNLALLSAGNGDTCVYCTSDLYHLKGVMHKKKLLFFGAQFFLCGFDKASEHSHAQLLNGVGFELHAAQTP